MYVPDGESLTGAGMAAAARCSQILGIYCRARIRRRKDVVYSMAARAIGHRLRARFRRQSVERRIEANQPVRRKPKLARQPHVAMAGAASVTDIFAVHRRRGVTGWKDRMLAMTIRAYRRLQ